MKKYWWARVKDSDDYGRWVPTGCVDKSEAIWYMAIYPGERHVKEWLLL